MTSAPAPDLAEPPIQCNAGLYEGTFNGMLRSNISPDMGPVSGTLALTLMAVGGEFFTISNGHLDGVAQVVDPNTMQTTSYPYSADLTGTLNCGTFLLENGKLTNGQVTVQGIPFTFLGIIDGVYDPKTLKITGEWEGKETNNLVVADGAWQATWKHP